MLVDKLTGTSATSMKWGNLAIWGCLFYFRLSVKWCWWDILSVEIREPHSQTPEENFSLLGFVFLYCLKQIELDKNPITEMNEVPVAVRDSLDDLYFVIYPFDYSVGVGIGETVENVFFGDLEWLNGFCHVGWKGFMGFIQKIFKQFFFFMVHRIFDSLIGIIICFQSEVYSQ